MYYAEIHTSPHKQETWLIIGCRMALMKHHIYEKVGMWNTSSWYLHQSWFWTLIMSILFLQPLNLMFKWELTFWVVRFLKKYIYIFHLNAWAKMNWSGSFISFLFGRGSIAFSVHNAELFFPCDSFLKSYWSHAKKISTTNTCLYFYVPLPKGLSMANIQYLLLTFPMSPITTVLLIYLLSIT